MSKAAKQSKALEKHFEEQHNNPPQPFNPRYLPGTSSRLEEAARSMEADEFYDTHTREECSVEIKKRWGLLQDEYRRNHPETGRISALTPNQGALPKEDS